MMKKAKRAKAWLRKKVRENLTVKTRKDMVTLVILVIFLVGFAYGIGAKDGKSVYKSREARRQYTNSANPSIRLVYSYRTSLALPAEGHGHFAGGSGIAALRRASISCGCARRS